MRSRHLNPGKKVALESEGQEEVKVVAPGTEDDRPQEPTDESAPATIEGGSTSADVKVDAEVTVDAGPVGKEEIVVADVAKDEDDRPMEPEIQSEDSSVGEIAEVELEIAKVNEEASSEANDYFEVKYGEEVLESYAVQLRHLIKTNTCTPQTARILKTAINNQLRSVSLTTPSVSLESMKTPETVKEQHQKMLDAIVMEGVTSRQMSQSMVVLFKHGKNAISDFFRGVEGRMKKYEEILETSHREFLSAKSSFKTDKHIGYLTELWYHFANEAGPVKNIIAALEHDITLTQYILNEYAPAVMQEAVNLTNICKAGDLSTPEGIQKVVAAVEKLPHPADLFKPQFIKGQSYLSVTHLDYEKQKMRQVIDAGGKSFEKLAYLASPKKVIEVGSSKQTAKKIAAFIAQSAAGAIPVPGTSAVAMGVAGKIAGSFMMTTAEIEKVFIYGKHYLEIVKHFLQNEDKLEDVGVAMDEAVGKLAATAKDSVGKKVASQIRDFSFATLIYNYSSPARDEVARAIKSAKYCGYLGKRMIYNAKRTTKRQVHE